MKQERAAAGRQSVVRSAVSAPGRAGRAGLGGGDAPRGAGPPPAGVGSAAGARCRWAGAGGMEAAGGPGGARARGLRGAPRPAAGGRAGPSAEERPAARLPPRNRMQNAPLLAAAPRAGSLRGGGRSGGRVVGGGAPARRERGGGRAGGHVGRAGGRCASRSRPVAAGPPPPAAAAAASGRKPPRRRSFSRAAGLCEASARGALGRATGRAGGSGPQLRRRRPRTCPPPPSREVPRRAQSRGLGDLGGPGPGESGEGWRPGCGLTRVGSWTHWAPDGQTRGRPRDLHSAERASAGRDGVGSPLGQCGRCLEGGGRLALDPRAPPPGVPALPRAAVGPGIVGACRPLSSFPQGRGRVQPGLLPPAA